MNIKALCSVIIKSRYKVLEWKKRATDAVDNNNKKLKLENLNTLDDSVILLFYFLFEIIVLDYARECP